MIITVIVMGHVPEGSSTVDLMLVAGLVPGQSIALIIIKVVVN